MLGTSFLHTCCLAPMSGPIGFSFSLNLVRVCLFLLASSLNLILTLEISSHPNIITLEYILPLEYPPPLAECRRQRAARRDSHRVVQRPGTRRPSCSESSLKYLHRTQSSRVPVSGRDIIILYCFAAKKCWNIFLFAESHAFPVFRPHLYCCLTCPCLHHFLVPMGSRSLARARSARSTWDSTNAPVK